MPQNTPQDTAFDAIVIGSGMGGLTTASLLTQVAGMRVAVLERHFRLGGFTHAFSRKGFTWDVGLHYVGDMTPGRSPRALMDYITGSAVEWDPMPHDFDVFRYPGLDFAVPADPAQFRDRLALAFPKERAGIDAYLADVNRAASWFGSESWSWSRRGPLRAALSLVGARRRPLGTATTASVLERHFRDPKLRALLASQWGDYGLPPSRSAFAVHALIVQHYLHGGWTPRGGSEAIVDAAVQVIEAGGGSCLPNHEVTGIVIENGRAVGVDVHVRRGKGGRTERFSAPLVISDAGASTTYGRLLPEGAAPGMAAAVRAAEPSRSSVALYLGLRESPAGVGLTGANEWLFSGFDHDAAASDPGLFAGRPSSAFVSTNTPADQTRKPTAQIVALCPPDAFEPWNDTTWMRRGADYAQLKKTISQGLLAFVEDVHPGFSDLVEYAELSTPLSVETFTGHAGGAIYGLAATPARLQGRLVAARSPIPGLLLSGSDVCAAGIVGALMGGVFASAEALGLSGMPRIFRAAMSQPAAA